ncbi:hypothetical protein BDV29DRAFT_162609 [Aspergillus leporis]|uniref:Uncharacterized protein n=1 Tax=Aspergillus leporis TaxID=41062 RepID=A0A5N5WI78_9EURO|nr:hypothetical protein BDV29DRAFT_162609 [Aspergillus leporis]
MLHILFGSSVLCLCDIFRLWRISIVSFSVAGTVVAHPTTTIRALLNSDGTENHLVAREGVWKCGVHKLQPSDRIAHYQESRWETLTHTPLLDQYSSDNESKVYEQALDFVQNSKKARAKDGSRCLYNYMN